MAEYSKSFKTSQTGNSVQQISDCQEHKNTTEMFEPS